MELFIAHLNSDDASELECNKSEIKKEVVKHPNREIYTLAGFVEAFNEEEISDLSYIALAEKVGDEYVLFEE